MGIKKGIHLYYDINQETKFAYYEYLWKRKATDLLNKQIAEEQRHATKILDVGSGRGEMMQLLGTEGYLVTGCDFDDECVRLSSRYGICNKVDMMNLKKEYGTGQFDVVVALHVLEHTENPCEVVKQFLDVTKQYLLIAVPNLSSLALINWSNKINTCNLGHYYGWNYSHFENFLKNKCGVRVIGWEVDCVRMYDTLPYLSVLDNFFHKTGIRAIFEDRFLPELFPRLSNSIIALCVKAQPEFFVT